MTVDYKLAKIYKIVCNVTGLVYVGSTCEPALARRLAVHKSDYKRYLNGKYPYVTSFKVLENNNYTILLIESLPNCTSRDELHKREGYYIKRLTNVNKRAAGNTRGERLLQMKQYNQTHAEHIKQQRDSERINCECGSTHQRGSKTQHMRTNKHIDFLETQKQAENVNIPVLAVVNVDILLN